MKSLLCVGRGPTEEGRAQTHPSEILLCLGREPTVESSARTHPSEIPPVGGFGGPPCRPESGLTLVKSLLCAGRGPTGEGRARTHASEIPAVCGTGAHRGGQSPDSP